MCYLYNVSSHALFGTSAVWNDLTFYCADKKRFTQLWISFEVGNQFRSCGMPKHTDHASCHIQPYILEKDRSIGFM